MKDNLKICPCGKSNACYEQRINTWVSAKMCYGCGFWTNSLMRQGQKFLKEQLEICPEIYKEIMWEDETGKLWLPKIVNIPDQGMVFLNGTDKDKMVWTAILAKKISKEEQIKYPVPNMKDSYYTHKMDNTTKKDFEKHDYIGALTYIGVLPSDEIEAETTTKTEN